MDILIILHLDIGFWVLNKLIWSQIIENQAKKLFITEMTEDGI